MKLALFTQDGGYGIAPYFTRCFAKALRRKSINCTIYNMDKESHVQSYLNRLVKDPPDCSGAITGKYTCNYDFLNKEIQIPHFAYCVDAPIYFFKLFENPYIILSYIDRWLVRPFSQFSSKQAFFLPHAADRELLTSPATERPIDILMIGALFDFEAIRSSWRVEFSEQIWRSMEESLELIFSRRDLSFAEALLWVFCQKGVDLTEVNLVRILDCLEGYIRGKDRFELIRAIKNYEVTIYGTTRSGLNGWKDYLGIYPNIKVYPGEISISKTLKLMKQSKIVLNSTPSFQNGSHERIFNGFLTGSAVVTNDNPFWREYFTEKELLFYHHGAWDKINGLLPELLNCEKVRQEAVIRGQQIVLNHHTWDHRADTFLKVYSGWKVINNKKAPL